MSSRLVTKVRIGIGIVLPVLQEISCINDHDRCNYVLLISVWRVIVSGLTIFSGQ